MRYELTGDEMGWHQTNAAEQAARHQRPGLRSARINTAVAPRQ